LIVRRGGALALVLALGACERGFHAQTMDASMPAVDPVLALEKALREDVTPRARGVVEALAVLDRAVRSRDVRLARPAFVEARARVRGLAPIARDLAPVAWSQLDPWGDDPDERSRFAGLSALDVALHGERWDDADRTMGTLSTAARLLEGELAAQDFSLTRTGAALSNGVFVLGARADGSDSFDEATRLADVRAEVDGLARLLGPLAVTTRTQDRLLADRLDAHAAAIGPLAARAPRGMLELLRRTGVVGADVRAAYRALGADISPPLFPRRSVGDDALAPVSIATFPRLAKPVDARLIPLGAALFASPVFSERRDVSCVGCHDPARAFAHADPPTLTFEAKVPPRNAPGLYGVGYEPTFFWDGRASSLDAQIDVAVARDMGGRWDEIVRRVSADVDLGPRFRDAGVGPTPTTIKAAIEAFELGLVDDDAAFDRAVRGEAALPADVDAGFDLYFGKARCSRCHRLPLTSGVVPPRFLRTELSSIGVPQKPGLAVLDRDPGRFAVTRLEADKGLFKVPALRHVAQTAPYFHNGAFRTLGEVIDFYAKGGGPGLGLAVPNADPDLAPFEISPEERAQLIAFLERGL
jgi:cytochrome c peroxidase